MAISGHNSDNETFIGLSPSIGLTFYDEFNNEIEISQSSKPIDISIQRDPATLDYYPFSYVNAISIGFLKNSYFLQNSFTLNMSNASLHIELKPLNSNIGYLLVLKLGYMPIVSATKADYSSFQLFCPSTVY